MRAGGTERTCVDGLARASAVAGRGWAGSLKAFAGGALLPIAVASALLSLAMPVEEALYAILGSWRYVLNPEVAEMLFYREGMGLDDPAHSAIKMLVATSGYALVLLPAVLVARRVARQPRWIRLAVAIVLFIVVAGGLKMTWRPIAWAAAAVPLPLFMLALGVALGVRIVRNRSEPRQASRTILPITMVVFALILLLKMALNARVHHYGFALAMPATLLLVVALLDWIPAGLTRLGAYGPAFRSAALAGLMVAGWMHLSVIDVSLSAKLAPVAGGADAFLADRRGAPVNWALKQVSRRLTADQTLVVVPEGVMINYLGRRENPTPYHTFMPPEMLLFGEHKILASLAAHRPDYFLVVHRDTLEYGYRFFGRDYGQEMFAWIESNYRPVCSTGGPPLRGESFGMVLMRRLDAE